MMIMLSETDVALKAISGRMGLDGRKYVVGALIRAPSLLNNISVKIFNMTTAKDKITSRTLTTRARMLQRKKTSTTQSNIIASPVMNNLNLSTFMMMMIMMVS